MIKSYEGQTVGSAMIDAIVAQEIRRQKTVREAELEAEVNTLRRELEIRKRQDAEIYTQFVDEPVDHSVISDIYWALVGWVVLIFAALSDALRV